MRLTVLPELVLEHLSIVSSLLFLLFGILMDKRTEATAPSLLRSAFLGHLTRFEVLRVQFFDGLRLEGDAPLVELDERFGQVTPLVTA